METSCVFVSAKKLKQVRLLTLFYIHIINQPQYVRSNIHVANSLCKNGRLLLSHRCLNPLNVKPEIVSWLVCVFNP